jgi:hypothetical protein
MKKEKVNTIHILTLKSIINSLVSVYIKKKKILQEVLSQRNKELRMKAEWPGCPMLYQAASWGISCSNAHWFSQVQASMGGANLPFLWQEIH